MALKVYDPAQVVVIFGGHKVEGMAPSSRVKISFPELYNKVVGIDGEVARGKNNNRTSSVSIELLQTSSSNDVLMGFFIADDVAPNGAPLPLMIKNINGTTLFVAAGAWIKKLPEVSYAAEVGANVWEIDCGETESFVGGQVSAI
jgi:hypothetical protein